MSSEAQKTRAQVTANKLLPKAVLASEPAALSPAEVKAMMHSPERFVNREISWLYFKDRKSVV